MSERLSDFRARRRYRFAIAASLWVVLALAGGASRPDEDQQAVVRIAALAAIAASLWPLDFSPLRLKWRGGLFACAAVLLLGLQLIPLPPALWAAVPGHGPYAEIANATGAVVWRPLSLTPDFTFDALMALLPATAMGPGALFLDSRARLGLMTLVVLSAGLSAGLSLLQTATGGLRLFREADLDVAVGLFANQNHQAAFLACALPLIGAVGGLKAAEGQNRIALPAALATSVLLLIAIILTGSRMGLLLGGLGLLGGIWCWRVAGNKLLPRSGPVRIATGAAAGAALAGLAVAVAFGGASARLAAHGVGDDTRVAMIGPLQKTAGAFMPVGAGFGSFETVYRRFEPDRLLSTISMNQAHDEPMQLAIEGGVPALVLLAIFCGWWVIKAAASLESRPAPKRAVLCAAVMVTGLLMLSSLVDYPLHTPLLGALFALACIEMSSHSSALAANLGRVLPRRRSRAVRS